jgi:hypothetical protein
MRVGVGWLIGSYDYSQVPRDIQGNILYQNTVELGGDGDPGAVMQGVAISADAWLPGLSWVGADFTARIGAYAMKWPNSPEIIRDGVPQISAHAKARYAFSEGGATYYAAAKIGFLYGDLITFTYTDVSNPTLISFDPLTVTGLSLGAELGAELPAYGLYFRTALRQGTRPATNQGSFDLGAYHTGVDITAGYEVLDNLSMNATYVLAIQQVGVALETVELEVGELSDKITAIQVGVEYAL